MFLFSIAIYLSTDEYLSPDDLDLLYETSEFASKLLKHGALPGETITVRDLAGTILWDIIGGEMFNVIMLSSEFMLISAKLICDDWKVLDGCKICSVTYVGHSINEPSEYRL